MAAKIKPPGLAVRLMEGALRSEVQRHGVIGDLTEEYMNRRGAGSRLAADLWFYRQALLVHWRFRSEARRIGSVRCDSNKYAGASGIREDMVGDLGFLFRRLLNRPLFGLSTVFTLALGIGACTAVFSLVSSILLRPLPYSDPERLVTMFKRPFDPEEARMYDPYPYFTYPEHEYWRENQDVFKSLAVYGGTGRMRIINFGEAVDQLRGVVVSADLFPTLGVHPFLGRAFRHEEDELGVGGVIVLSHQLWMTRFQGDPNVLGQSITVDGMPFNVIGVMARDFSFPDPEVLFWVSMATAIRTPNNNYLKMVGRLPVGVDPETARARVASLEGSGGVCLGFSTLKEEVIGSDIQGLLGLLATAVVTVLIIVCTNVASLLLSESASRRTEITIRAILGAGRARLVRQLITEATVLSLLGAVLGIGLAVLFTKGLLWVNPDLFPRHEEIGIHVGVLVFSLGLALVVGFSVGVIPALQSSRPNLVGGLVSGVRGVTRGGGRGRVRDLLVATQTAMAFTLIVGAGLLINSFVRQWTNPTGFSAADKVLAMNVKLPGGGMGEGIGRYATHQLRLDFFENLIDRLKANPAIRSATLTSRLPFSQGRSELPIQIEGLPADAGARNRTRIFVIAPEYFTTMGVQIGDERPWLTVVGVVAATRQTSITEEYVPQVYLNYVQGERGFAHHGMVLLVGTTSSPHTAAPVVRSTLADIDPGVPISNLASLKSLILTSIGEVTFLGLLVSFFGFVALLLALQGVSALVSQAVTHRTREIGIRLALGAKPRDIILEVTLRSFYLTVLGLAAGILAAFWAVELLRSFLFEISPWDIPTFGIALLLLATSAMVASLVPALRATRLDPLRSLSKG